MPRNMKIRIAIEWSDTNEQVFVDGKPLEFTESQFISMLTDAAVATFVCPEDKSLRYSKEQLSEAIDNAFEHPGLPWYKLTTQNNLQGVTSAAIKMAVEEACVELAKIPQDKTYQETVVRTVGDTVRRVVPSILRELKKQTIRAF